MTLVRIVYVPDADRRGPDLTRIGQVEDIDPDLARVMLGDGSAVLPDHVDGDEPVQTLPPVGPEPVMPAGTPVPPADAEDLEGKTKDELQTLAAQRGVQVPAKATKADLVAALLAPAGETTGDPG